MGFHSARDSLSGRELGDQTQSGFMAKNLYSILGVQQNATQADIRRAYKRKAKALHPDLHPEDEEKLNQFKAVSSAYEVLGDAGKRQQYDRGEIDADGQPRGFSQHSHPGGAGFGGGAQGDVFEDILSGMFGGGRRRPGPQKGRDVRYRVEIAFADAIIGANREMTMADGRVLNVSLPAGVETGQILRLKSQGHPTRTLGPPGDALLEIVVRESSVWQRDGLDLRMNVQVPLRTALLGGQVDVATPSGTVTLKIPQGANAGTVLRLKGKGVQVKTGPGHLFVKLELFIEDPDNPGLLDWARGYTE